MNPNTPRRPAQHSEAGHHPDPSEVAPPLPTDNPYFERRQSAAPPELDASAPHLASNELRRLNRRALGFLAAIVAILLGAALLLLNGGAADRDAAEKHRPDDTVSIPRAPSFPPPMPEPAPPATRPIALAPPPLLSPVQLGPTALDDEPRGPTLLERRMRTEGSVQVVNVDARPDGVAQGIGNVFNNSPVPADIPGALPQSLTGGIAYQAPDMPPGARAEMLTHPDTLMLRGTFIRCVLETRIVTDIPGFTSCIVSEPVYSFTGKRLLLAKGSKVLGKYATEPNGPRVAVVWDRIVTPGGIDVNMSSPGVDTLGGAGHPGHYDAHWGSRVGAAMLISMLGDAFKYEAAVHGPRQTAISGGVITETPFESNTAQTVQSLANSAVKRAASRPATVTINQGSVLAIYVARDIDFSSVVKRY